jgi:hypothetical protein
MRLAVLQLLLLVTSVSADCQSVSAILQSHGELSIFRRAVQAVHLLPALADLTSTEPYNQKSNLTLFAPRDESFRNAFAAFNQSESIFFSNTTLVAQFVWQSAVPLQSIDAQHLSSGSYVETMLPGHPLKLLAESGALFAQTVGGGYAKTIQTYGAGCGEVVNVLDRVLLFSCNDPVCRAYGKQDAPI